VNDSNKLWLVCRYHPHPSHAFCLGKRLGTGYYGAPRPQALDAWYDEHAQCGGTLDHFAISYSATPDIKANAVNTLLAAVHQELDS
jgi:hypothetical protein